jgi:cell division topological specificity factor
VKLLSFFKRPASAGVARERLQILLAHERVVLGSKSNLVAQLREEILAVIAKHISIDRDKVRVKMDHKDAITTLAVDIEFPTPGEEALHNAASAA